MLPSTEIMREMLRSMLLIRRFEEKVSELFASARIYGHIHLYLGQEASGVGVCANLTGEDYVVSNHRGHGHALAKGAAPRRVMAELFGRKTGVCKGKGGSMHVADFSKGIVGANGIVGGGLPIGTGAALACQILKNGRVTVVFFGDGAANQGTFHESANLAVVWNLPVIFICENNGYAITTPSGWSIAGGDMVKRAAGYGMPGVSVDGNDAVAVYRAAREAVERAQSGGGPSLIECKTYRHHGHSEGEEGLGWKYRSPEEIDAWLKRDPILLLKDRLLETGALTAESYQKMEDEVADIIKESVQFAEASPEPELEDTMTDIFAGAAEGR